MISNRDEITKDPPEKEIKFILELINSNKIAKTKSIYAQVRFIFNLIYSDKINF